MPRMEVLFLGLFILLKEEKHGERVQLILEPLLLFLFGKRLNVSIYG